MVEGFEASIDDFLTTRVVNQPAASRGSRTRYTIGEPSMANKDEIPAGVNTTVTTTQTNLTNLRRDLRDWLAKQTGDPDLRVEEVSRNSSTGMSSVSVLFSTVRIIDGITKRTPQVLRMVPEESALPVFPEYDLRAQSRVMNAVADFGAVPVPRVRWIEDIGDVLGRPFLVMDRAEGHAPQDNPPYVFDSWMLGANPSRLAELQRNSIVVMAEIHRTPNPEAILGLSPGQTPQQRLQSVFDEAWSYYEWTLNSGGMRIPSIEAGFDWVRAHWPSTVSNTTLCWGDARIGNILYDGVVPTAVLDWEAATAGPPELDVAWFIFFHRMYQDMADAFGRPGLPKFLRPADVIDEFQQISGRKLNDMRFHLVFAAVRCAIIFARIKQRTVHFGDTTAPATADEYVLHHSMLNQLIHDKYEWSI
ncbi:phosphotransferase family protein [Rhodococcus sp. BP22]|uniref:phosphotransferase family protein n=1 Tax=Rhodococcus sp. BP22 TaxID=2758566 RepID=UPI0028F73030|nr:phosphotransferase family protein [Rhodococcus sp. BP22]